MVEIRYDANTVSSEDPVNIPGGPPLGKVMEGGMLYADLRWEQAKYASGPTPGPYCSNNLEGVSGEDNVPNTEPDPSEPFCWGAQYISPGKFTLHYLNVSGVNGHYGGWEQGWEMWVERPINQYGNFGPFGAWKTELGLWPQSPFTHPCMGTSWSQSNNTNPPSYSWIGPITFEDAYCFKLSPNTNYPWGNYLALTSMWFTQPGSNITVPFYNYDESVWATMGDSSNSASTYHIMNRILQEISTTSKVKYTPYPASFQAGGGVDWKYAKMSWLTARLTPVSGMYTSINATDAGSYGQGAGQQIFNPPLSDQVLIDGALYPGSKLKPGEHCISYACHYDTIFVEDTPWDPRNVGCHSHSPWSSNPLNNYYSWVTLDEIVVYNSNGSWQPSPKWSFSNSTGWTANIPASSTVAEESAIGRMMYLGNGAWDSSVGPVNHPDGSSSYGGPTGVCWLPANQGDAPGTGHWVRGPNTNGGGNGGCPPANIPPSSGAYPYHYGSNPYMTAHATASNIGHIDNTNWRNKPDANAYYKGIRPSYSYLDVTQHLVSMKEHMPLSYENPNYRWSNRPCGHPTGLPPGCSGAGCALAFAGQLPNPPAGSTISSVWCGGHQPNGLPNSVNHLASSGGFNSSQNGGTCCSTSFMNSAYYKNAAFDDIVPGDGLGGTFDGQYNGYNCCNSRWLSLSIPPPRLTNGLQCDGCNVGCCVNEFNEIDICESPVINGLFRELHDCQGAHDWESQVIVHDNSLPSSAHQLLPEDSPYEKLDASNLVPETFCKEEMGYNEGCLDPLAWNFCSTCNADCMGSSAYRQTTQSGSILNSTIDYSCCIMEKPGWECNPSLPGCTQSCQSTVPNHMTECFETQAECEDETICAPGWSCDPCAAGGDCLQNCVATRIWDASQNQWDESSIPSSANGWRPCYETELQCDNEGCDGITWDCLSTGLCIDPLDCTGQYLDQSLCNAKCAYTGPCNNTEHCNGSAAMQVFNSVGQLIWTPNGSPSGGSSSKWLHFKDTSSVPQLPTLPNNGIGTQIGILINGTTVTRTIVDVVNGGNWESNQFNSPACSACGGDAGMGCWNYYLELDQNLTGLNANCTTSGSFLGGNNANWAAGSYTTNANTLGWWIL